MKKISSVSLIGLGAVGAYLASNLQSTMGDNFRIIASGERKSRIEREGIVANGKQCHFNVVSPDEKTGYADLAIIIPKFSGLRDALEDMKNQIGPDTIILAPLNGIDAELIVGEMYPAENIISSLMMISCKKNGNVCSFDSKTGAIQFGEDRNEVLSERVTLVKDLFESSNIRVLIPEDMVRAKWVKYMTNVSENQASSVLGICYKAWTGICPSADFVRDKLCYEVIAIAKAKGINLSEADMEVRRKRMPSIPSQNKTSSLQDIEAHRHTEVDIFSGTIMRLGKEYGIPTPYNELFYHMIKVIEARNDGEFAE